MKKEDKPKKLKCYVLTVSRNFPSTHPRKGDETLFLDKIKFGTKKHTIRNNYELWKNRIDEINSGLAYLSVRYWEGKPYNSKQEEAFKFKSGEIGIQKLEFDSIMGIFLDDIDIYFTPHEMAKNDGLSYDDFKYWFEPIKINEPYAIIHFTDFRY